MRGAGVEGGARAGGVAGASVVVATGTACSSFPERTRCANITPSVRLLQRPTPFPLHTLPLFPPHSLLPCLPAVSQAALAAIGVCIRRKSAEADASPTHDKCLLYISAGGAAAGKGAGKE